MSNWNVSARQESPLSVCEAVKMTEPVAPDVTLPFAP